MILSDLHRYAQWREERKIENQRRARWVDVTLMTALQVLQEVLEVDILIYAALGSEDCFNAVHAGE